MAEWSAQYINDLPDSSFLYIEPGGEKDEQGKTTPRSLRHFPVKDAEGTPDPAHVRNALARIPQSDVPASVKDRCMAQARGMLDQMNAGKSAGDLLATAVKFVGKDTIEGPLFLFGGPIGGRDAHGELFTPDTDFCLDWFGKSGRPLLYEHGMDPALKTSVIGRQVDYEQRDEGIWAQSQLDTNARYRKAIDALIGQGALGYSGGAMPHLATKDARTGAIKRFPWVEATLSPTPANPDNLGVYYVKSALALSHWEEAGEDMPIAALKALADWADARDDQPDGLTFAAHADRLLVDVQEFLDRTTEVAAVRVKSGRVLSAATRDRLAKHPGLIRQVADDLDELLQTADAGKSATADFLDELVATGRLDERLRGLPIRGIPA